MKSFKIYPILFLFIAVLFTGCKKDDDEATPSKEDMIAGSSSKSWKITGAEGKLLKQEYGAFRIDFYNNNKVYTGEQEIPAGFLPPEFKEIPSFPACAKDDIVVFKADKTYETSEGADLCTGQSEFIVLSKGTWALSNDEKTLVLKDNSGAEVSYNLTDLSAQSMKGDTSGSIVLQGTSVDYSLTTTFTAQ